MLDGNMKISDLFSKLKSGELDKESDPIVELEGVEIVNTFAGKSRDNVNIRLDKNAPIHIVESKIGMFIKFRINQVSNTASIVERWSRSSHVHRAEFSLSTGYIKTRRQIQNIDSRIK